MKLIENFEETCEIIASLSGKEILSEEEMDYVLENGDSKIISSKDVTLNKNKYGILATHFNDGEYPDEMNTSIYFFKYKGVET